ncbi:MAG: signal peptidase I [Chloroflexota bacterium]|nr:signal peptidase I [Chloroflexota bacterium]
MDGNQGTPASAWGAAAPKAAGTSESTESPVAAPIPAESRGDSARALTWEIIQTVLLTIVIFLAVRSVVQNFRVEGASMDPTLRTGQYLLINKVLYARADGTPLEWAVQDRTPNDAPNFVFGGPERGDIIVFRAPGQSDKDFIKRVIGLPGESVRIEDGRVFINGKPLDEPYITHRATYDLDQKVVPPGSYFVLGDNRPNSSDSHLGWFVPANNIIGKAWVSYWPPTRWGVMPAQAYAE